jgi:uncharacterized damage-inducible protein DinB
MVDRSFARENQAERERLQSLVENLSDADMARPLGGGWTVSAQLAHLAFWDRLWLEKFEEWERTGIVRIPLEGYHRGPGPATQVDAVNNAMLPWWLAMEFDEVRHEVVAAAEAIDRRIETLSDPELEQLLTMRPRTATRAVHRREHLSGIEHTHE